MKITKRQLRNTIRKVIKENIRDTLPGSSWAAAAEQEEIDEMSDEFYVDQLMKAEFASGNYLSLIHI